MIYKICKKKIARDVIIFSQQTHEPPKLKTTLKTPPKQATNPLQFVKVGPCSLYRTAQEQLQKVQEVKKIKQEVRDDPEDWQSVSLQFDTHLFKINKIFFLYFTLFFFINFFIGNIRYYKIKVLILIHYTHTKLQNLQRDLKFFTKIN